MADLNVRLSRVETGGGTKAREKHQQRGKLLVRDRIDMLVDVGTAFLELSPLAAEEQYDNAFPAAGIVTGIGQVAGHTVVVIANDATVKGGTYVRETIKKHIRALEIAMENRLPAIYLVDSGGIFLPEQAQVFPDKEDFGRIFFMQARLSAGAIPQLAIVMGSCTAGGAYVPAMSDEAIIVKNQGTVFIGGPPLVKAATGEEVTDEELGGGDVHARISGVVDHLAEDDADALQMCRSIVQTFPEPTLHGPKLRSPFEQPQYPAEELQELIAVEGKTPVDAHEIIARLVDGSEFQPFKEMYAPTIVTGFAYIEGQLAGILANNGVIYAETARKAAHFIQLCESRGIPLIFLQNITGFIVGKKYEHEGIARDGAKLIHAVANARVPKLTVITGGSYGAGNYAMAGRAYNPRFLFMWPQAKIGVMGGEQAASVLMQVKTAALKKQGKMLSQQESEAMEREIQLQYRRESSAIYSTSRLWDDGIIRPEDTRKVLSLALSVVRQSPVEPPKRGVFRM
ncbi:MAG: acyl-CoA carboxylase subunit beta [Bacteroidota bacterium]